MTHVFRYDDLVGVPYADGGRDRSGYDCWGLARELFHRQGYELPLYPIDPHDTEQIDRMTRKTFAGWEKLEKPEAGCLVLLRLSMGGWANHVGICIENRRFIHAYSGAGVCIDRLSHWRSRIAGFYMPGGTNGTDYRDKEPF